MRQYIIGIFAVLALASCGSDSADDIASRQDQEILDYLAENNITDWERTESGLYYRITESVDEPRVMPTLENFIEINYTGYFSDGEIFESTFMTSGPIRFQLGSSILGWQEGFQLMAEGESATFYIPSRLALGETGAQEIPPNTWLIFDVELVDVDNRTPAELAADQDDEIRAYLERNEIDDWSRTASGLYYVITDNVPEPRRTPTSLDVVTVNYRGYFESGVVFDSSFDRGVPSTFALNAVIAGWQEGLQLIAEGESATLFVPSHLAYGRSGNASIPPDTWLIFDIELLNF